MTNGEIKSNVAFNWYHNEFDHLDFRTLYAAANRAKKHGYETLGRFIKAVTDHHYAREKMNVEDTVKHLDTIIDLVDAAYAEAHSDPLVMDIVLKRVNRG